MYEEKFGIKIIFVFIFYHRQKGPPNVDEKESKLKKQTILVVTRTFERPIHCPKEREERERGTH